MELTGEDRTRQAARLAARLASVWDEACQETYGRGHMHDSALAEMLARNPYRAAVRAAPSETTT